MQQLTCVIQVCFYLIFLCLFQQAICTCCFESATYVGLLCPADAAATVWIAANGNIEITDDFRSSVCHCVSFVFLHIFILSSICVFCGSENVQLMRLCPKMEIHLELPCCWAAELILKCILFCGSLFRVQISALTRVHVVVTKHNMLWLVWDSSPLLTASCCRGFMPHRAAYHRPWR